jgi:N6-adenosine-specific RNA methylase IME4
MERGKHRPRAGLTRVEAVRPIVIGHYKLTATGMDVDGRPDFAEHASVGEFIRRAQFASGFWLADWLRYGDSRHEWQERLEQAIDATGYSEKTLKNVRAVGAIEKSRRREGIEFGLHDAVASLEPEEQSDWLERAAENGWGVRELRLSIRAARRRRVLEGQATLTGMYRVIYADPPWLYGDSGPTADGSLGKSERHYPGMTIDELCRLPVAAHCTPHAVLFLWTTAPFLMMNPGPREVLEAWGFDYKTGLVWDKVFGNFGHYVHVAHEHLLICTRGSCLPDEPIPSPSSVYHERRSSIHSEKPAGVRKLIEQLYTTGPYLELFGREPVPGWSVFGNDTRLWAEEAAS